MAEPLILVAHQKIKQGKVEEYKKCYQDVAELMEASKPQTADHIAYVSEDGVQASVVHIFPDAEAMEMHMQGLGDLGMKAFSLMEIVGFDIYGTPSKMVPESLLRMAGPGAKVDMKPSLRADISASNQAEWLETLQAKLPIIKILTEWNK